MAVRLPLISAAAVVAAAVTVTIATLPSADHSASSGDSIPQHETVTAAALAGDQALFNTVVMPGDARTSVAAKINPNLAAGGRKARGISRDAAIAYAARARAHIYNVYSGKQRVKMLTASRTAFDMAVPHEPSTAGAPVSVVNTGGGVTNFTVESESVNGINATVVAKCATWLDTNVYYADGTEQTFTPRSDEIDTIRLSEDPSSGGWTVTDISWTYPDGGP